MFLCKSKEKTVSEPIVESTTMRGKYVWNKVSLAMLLLLFLLLSALGIAGYWYYQYTQSPPVREYAEMKSLVAKIGKMIEIPTDEAPTLATVTNKQKLDNQLFFQRAENGDKILIYSKNRRAILYRPSTERIIDVAVVDITQEQYVNPLISDVQ